MHRVPSLALCITLIWTLSAVTPAQAQHIWAVEDGGYPRFTNPLDTLPNSGSAGRSASMEGTPAHVGTPPPPGSILVGSFFDNAVVAFDTAGNLLGTFTDGMPPFGPEGLVFGTNGNLLVVSRTTNSVLEYDGSSGSFIGTFIDDGLNFPHGMIKDGEGNLLIASSSAVVKFDGLSGALIGVFAEIPGTLIDLAFGPSGNLFVSAEDSDAVVEVDSETGEVLGIFASGGGLTHTNKLLFGGPADDLFAGGDSPDAIFQYDGLSGAFIGIFASEHGMDGPGPALTHPNGNLLIGTGFGNTLLEFDFGTGDFIGTFADEGLDFPTFAIVVPEQSSSANLDIRPGSCPNPFNRHGNGVLPGALVGTVEFDPTEVDLSTLQLSRADGVGGSVAPNEGPPGPHSVFEDVATPFDGKGCECHDLGGDGIDDLSMKFKTRDLVDALELDELPGGAVVELVLSGSLLDGTPFVAGDCIVIVPPGDLGPISATVGSNVGDTFIEVTPLDLNIDSDGFTSFGRAYYPGTLLTVTAPLTSEGRRFVRWRVNGVLQEIGVRTIEVTVAEDTTLQALYHRQRRLRPDRPTESDAPLD